MGGGVKRSAARRWKNGGGFLRKAAPTPDTDVSHSMSDRSSATELASTGRTFPKDWHAEARRHGVELGPEKSLDHITGHIVDAALRLHKGLGPGLLESVYELVLARDLDRRGLRAARQQPISFEYDGLQFRDCLRVDLLVEARVIVEIKSVERPQPVHRMQLLTCTGLSKSGAVHRAKPTGRAFPRHLRVSAPPRESFLGTSEDIGDWR
jgi:GxxExxY protein